MDPVGPVSSHGPRPAFLAEYKIPECRLPHYRARMGSAGWEWSAWLIDGQRIWHAANGQETEALGLLYLNSDMRRAEARPGAGG